MSDDIKSAFITKEEAEARLAKIKPFETLGDKSILEEIKILEEVLRVVNPKRTDSKQPTVSQAPSAATEQVNNHPSTIHPIITEQTNINPIIPQPVVQPITCQQQPIFPVTQPVFVTPTFKGKESKSEKSHHKYVPIVYDDINEYVTYVTQTIVDSSDRLSMEDYKRLSQECRRSSKRDSEDIGRIYIHNAEDYGTMIKLDIGYINANEKRERKTVFVKKDACRENKLYKVLIRNDIHCFNAKLSQQKISEYLYQLILSKMSDTKHELPDKCGFAEIEGEWCFVTEEYCEQAGLPSVTDKSFNIESEHDVTSEQVEEMFIRFTVECNDSELFLLLNIIRITGLLSTPLDYCGIRFNKIVFLNGDGEDLSKFLQVYDRGYMADRPYSINVTEDRLDTYFEDQKYCVVLLEDRSNTSVYQKKNGNTAIDYLSDLIYDHINYVYGDLLFVTVVFSERLSQMMKSNKALVIDYSGFSSEPNCFSYYISTLTQYLDDLIIKRVCSNFTDFQKCVEQNRPHYVKIAKQHKVDPVTFTCLMLAYHEMVKHFRGLNDFVSESEMGEYLAGILTLSDKRYNGGSISEEFKATLNNMLINNNLELVRNSSMNGCFGSTGTKPVMFNDDQWIYIPNDTFSAICEKMTLADTVGSVKKALHSEGWLRTSEDNMTYKATLYDTRYHGKLHVTAVTSSILSDEAMNTQKGGMFNFIPCKDAENERILLGTDEHGRNVYWSINRRDLNNTHMIVNGRSGTGKSTAVNLIAKELFNKNKQVVYVDFSHSNTPEKMKINGFNEEFQRKHISRYSIEDCLSDNTIMKKALSSMVTEHKIIIFEIEKYCDAVEDFLTLLYDTIASDSELNIFLVIDEIHELDYRKGSAVYHIIEKGRGNGVSLIGIFQGPHEVKPKQLTMMNQAEVKMIFKPSDQNDGKALADANALKPPGTFAEHLLGLKKRTCLVIGNLESDDNELMNGRFIEVTIPEI